jgi:hypothetical protein
MTKNLETLTAIEEIRLLKARYCRFADTKQWDEFKQLFTEDADVLMEFTPRSSKDAPMEKRHFNGREELVTQNAPNLEGITTIHNVFAHEITVSGPDSASGIWAMKVVVVMPHCIFTGWGHYHEIYTRSNSVWQFKKLHLTPLRTAEDWL